MPRPNELSYEGKTAADWKKILYDKGESLSLLTVYRRIVESKQYGKNVMFKKKYRRENEPTEEEVRKLKEESKLVTDEIERIEKEKEEGKRILEEEREERREERKSKGLKEKDKNILFLTLDDYGNTIIDKDMNVGVKVDEEEEEGEIEFEEDINMSLIRILYEQYSDKAQFFKSEEERWLEEVMKDVKNDLHRKMVKRLMMEGDRIVIEGNGKRKEETFTVLFIGGLMVEGINREGEKKEIYFDDIIGWVQKNDIPSGSIGKLTNWPSE
jgi:hypothetical protein